MTVPIELRGPAAAAIPLVLDSPHSGHAFPDDFGAVVNEADLREGEDCYVDELYAGGPELGAPLLAALLKEIGIFI
jgi:N-formylglutamate deformylase